MLYLDSPDRSTASRSSSLSGFLFVFFGMRASYLMLGGVPSRTTCGPSSVATTCTHILTK
jgi:hypothetical protein